MKRNWIALVLGLLACSGLAAEERVNPYLSQRREFTSSRRSMDWEDLDRSAVQAMRLVPAAKQALQQPGIRWRHGRSEHFVLHFRKKAFARRVARMAEFYLEYVSEDLNRPESVADEPSHIFIFHDRDEWKAFLATCEGMQQWAFSFVAGNFMYLQENRDTSSSGGTLAHEMTHLVLNRFLRQPPPLWLNEGLAEWYEEFAYAEFKGIKKSQRGEFKKLGEAFPLEEMLSSAVYPAEEQITAFYRTAKWVVGFLRLSESPEVFTSYLKDVFAGQPHEEALRRHYGHADSAALREALQKFTL